MGSAPFAISATSSSGLAVTFTSQITPVCTYGSSKVTLVAVGTCTIRASQAGNGNYAAAATVDQSFTVSQGAQTITFGTLANQSSSSPPFNVSATSSVGLAVTFSSLTAPICTVSGSTVTLAASGTCAIRASQPGNANYATAPNVDRSFSVTASAQLITFLRTPPQFAGVVPLKVRASASSGLAVTFSSQTPTLCTVGGNMVTVLTAGTCTVRASQAGSGVYAPAPDVDQSFNITTTTTGPLFLVPVNYATGAFPSSAAIGDFNGDGKSDVAVVNLSDSTVSIFLGNGDGTFEPGNAYPVGNFVNQIVVADFNGDGKLDFAVSEIVDQGITVYFGNGDGTFGSAAQTIYGVALFGIAAADFNGDGKPDLILTDGSSGGTAVIVALNNGSGAFPSYTVYSAGASPIAVAIGDLNGDGKKDMAIVNENSNTVSVFLGNGSGAFSGPTNYTVGYLPVAVAIADLNGDGKPDLVVANSGDNTVSVLLNSGTGAFATAIPYAVGVAPGAVAIADYDGDGKLDLAISNQLDNTVSFLRGNGDGTFAAAIPYGVGAHPLFVASGDFDGDGKPDLVVPAADINAISIFLHPFTGTAPASLTVQGGSPQSAAVYSAFATPLSVMVKDASNHALANVAVSFAAPASGASGTFAGSVLTVRAVSSGSGVATAPTLTANGTSGSYSVMASVNALSAIFALTNTAAAGQAPQFTSAPPPNGTINTPYSFAVTASGVPPPTFSVLSNALPTGLSLNGSSGLLNGTPTVGGTFSGMLTASNGNAPDASQSFAVTIGTLSQSITFGALANRALGTPPFGVSATASSGLTVSFAAQTPAICSVTGATVTPVAAGTCTVRASQAGNGTYAPAANVDQSFTVTANALPTVMLVSPANNSTYVAPALIPIYAIAADSDGSVAKVEFYNGGVLIGTATAAPYVFAWTNVGQGSYGLTAKVTDNSGASITTAIVNITVSSSQITKTFVNGFEQSMAADVIAVADLNGDGKLDLLTGTGNCGYSSYLLGHGDGLFDPNPVDVGGACPVVDAIVGNFDGDAFPDYAYASGVSIKVVRNVGMPSSRTMASYAGGPSVDYIAQGDLNGDGKTDLIAVDTMAKSFLPLINNGDGTFSNGVVVPLTFVPAAIAVVDVNGDGKLDVVLADPEITSGTSRIVTFIGNGNGTFVAGATYLTIDSPGRIVVGDFNGDGKVDIAVASAISGVAIHLGNGDGTFQPPFSYPSGGGASDIVVADFNGDGKLDIAATNYANSTVSILLGNGNGSFRPPESISVPSPSKFALGDFNSDGRVDLAVVRSRGADPHVRILMNVNGLTLQAPVITNGPPPDAIADRATGQTNYTFTYVATGVPQPWFSYDFHGLVLNPSGIASGVMTGVLRPGYYHVTVTAHNGVGQDATQDSTFLVSGAPDVITVSAPTILYYPGHAWVLTATLGRGGSVVWSSLTPDVCEINSSGEGVYPLAVGSCVVRATTTAGLDAAAPVTVTIPVVADLATVLITSPLDASYVAPGTSVALTATATPITGAPITQVAFHHDGVLIGTASTAPYSVTWSNVPAGTYQLTAIKSETICVPTCQEVDTTSTTVTLYVTSASHPTVSIDAPLANARFTAPATIPFSISATDPGNSINKVTLMNGDREMTSFGAPPYAFNWANAPPGTYQLTALVTTTAGIKARSAPLTVSVDTGIPFEEALFPLDDAWDTVLYTQDLITGGYAERQGAITKVTAGASGTKPDTCQAANFAGGAFDYTGFAADTTAAARTTVAFWINWNGTDEVVPLAWATEGLMFSGGKFGFTTFSSDIFGISSAGLSGAWHYVVAEFDNGGVATNRLVVDGVEQSLTQLIGTPNAANAVVTSSLRLGGKQGATSNRFIGQLDEIGVYDGAITAAQAVALQSISHPCTAPTLLITSPISGDSYETPATVDIYTSYPESQFTSIELHDNGTLVDSHVGSIGDRFTQNVLVSGTHTYTIVGHLVAGGTVTSNAVTVTVAPAIQSPVSATLSQPIAGATYYSGGAVNLASTANIPEGYAVAAVYFYANGQLVGYASGVPYNFVWQTPTAGTYTVIVRVLDTFGYFHDSAPITITVVAGLPDVTYYYNDIEGSPIAASDAAGTLMWWQNYYPYGERHIDQDTETQNGLWYTGKSTEDSTGLSYYGARWYNPAIGRFYGTDPQGFLDSSPLSINRYAYANNNPYRLTDPSGESPVDVAFLVVDLVRLGIAINNEENVGATAIDVGLSVIGVVAPIPFVGEALKGVRVAENATNGLASFERAAEYGIQSYKDLKKAKAGTGLEAHHLIEQRFAELFGKRSSEMASIALTKAEHNAFTQAWRSAIKYGEGTADATRESVLDAARNIYREYPDLLKANDH